MFREMRRADKQVLDAEWISKVIASADHLELGIVGRDGWPYIVPMSFGWDGHAIYLHGARRGLKLELLAQSPKVCFQIAVDVHTIIDERPEEATQHYRSVTGFGILHELTERAEKLHALNVIMDHYRGPRLEALDDRMDASVWTARIDIEHTSGKSSPPLSR